MKTRLLTVAALSAAALLFSSAPAMAQTAPCAFKVLHNDRIGALPVAAGTYQLNTNKLTCGQATTLFAQFLNDYDGKLPKPWRYNGENTFTRGTNGTSFTFVAQPTPTPNAVISHGEFLCPDTVRVLHNDRVGRLAVPRGSYQLTVLGPTLSCDDAEDSFAQFLSGTLADDWAVLVGSGEFVHTSIHDGFRIKRLISSAG